MFLESHLDRLLDRLRLPDPIPVRLDLWRRRTFDLGPDPSVTIRIPRISALRYLVSPDLMKLGEGYVEGHIEVDGSLADIFDVGERLARTARRTRRMSGLRRGFTQSRRGDKRAVQYHYDVSNDFYRLFLDRNLVYSCAYFRTERDSLDLAQEQKLDHILNKLALRPGERFLDIGCGWGALILRAVERYGATAVGVTLSRNQYDHVRAEIERRGLTGRCEVRLQDYRDIPERAVYDKIASVGMFEHVGLRNLPVYFRTIHRLLRDGGLVLNHGITDPDPERPWMALGAGQFIGRYVFPESELPHVSLVLKEMSAAALDVLDVESLRRHYARTCDFWANRLETNRERAIELADARRYRIWSIYLRGCVHGFKQGWITIYQVLACKSGGPEMNRLPLTRDYIYGG